MENYSIVVDCNDKTGNNVMFNKINVGNFEETKSVLLQQLDNKYTPQFDALTLAWAAASMDGDKIITNARLADKTTLKAEYTAKMEEIING